MDVFEFAALETAHFGSEGEDETTDDVPNTDLAYEENIDDDREHTKRSRGRHHWISPRLTATLDKAKVSCSDAVHILIACANDLITLMNNVEQPVTSVGELVINYSTIYQLRKENRKQEAEKAEAEFIETVN